MFKEYTSEDEELIKRIGERIRHLREEADLSQFKLAVKAEIPKNQVGRIERGNINTSLVTLGRIAVALDVELTELFSNE